MSKIFTPFEEKVRQTMDSYETPFDAKSWGSLEKQLAPKSGSGSNATWLVALVAATVFTGVASFVVHNHSFKVSKARGGYTVARFNQIPISPELKSALLYAEDNSVEHTSKAAANTIIPAVPNGISENSPETLSIVTFSDRFKVHPLIEEVDQIDAGSNNNVINNTGASSNSRDLRFAADVNNACVGYEVNFNLADSPSEGQYLWNFGDGTFSNKPNTAHMYSKPGSYDVSLSITSEGGVIRTNVQRDMIVIKPSPSADFEWEFVNDPTEAPTVKIINISDNASDFSWNFGDGKESEEISPVRSYTDKGKHMVALTVSNEHGCTDSKVKYIPVNTEYNLQAPQKINLGEDIFMPQALKSGKLKFKMTVYQGSTPIFETVNKTKGWDGSARDGSKVAAGQYPWIVILYNDRTNEEKYFSGLITVIP
jgi:PKD repeat protein